MSRFVDIEPLDCNVFTQKSMDFVDGVGWALEEVDKCQELNDCSGCKYEDTTEYSTPCNQCSRHYKDKYDDGGVES